MSGHRQWACIAGVVAAIALAIAPAYAEGPAYDASDLSGQLSRTISLTDTFFWRYDRLVDSHTTGSPYQGGVTSMDGTWFDGYSIKTDFGDQSGVLARVYGDVFMPFAGDRVSFIAGVGGYRYGVFLSGISLPLPSGDPLGGGSIGVTDFAGTQYFQDIAAASIVFRRKGSITVYGVTNSLYAPRSGVLDFQAPVSVTPSYGAKAAAFGIVHGDVLFSDAFEIQRATGGVDPLAIFDMLLNTRIGRVLFARTDLLWRAFKTAGSGPIPISWDKFLVPAELRLNTGASLEFAGGFALCSPGLQASLGTWVRSAWGSARLRLEKRSVNIAASASWFTDPRLASFSGGASGVFGYSVELSVDTRSGSARIGTRYDYYTDLDDLIESSGHRVFFCTLVLSDWRILGFR